MLRRSLLIIIDVVVTVWLLLTILYYMQYRLHEGCLYFIVLLQLLLQWDQLWNGACCALPPH